MIAKRTIKNLIQDEIISSWWSWTLRFSSPHFSLWTFLWSWSNLTYFFFLWNSKILKIWFMNKACIKVKPMFWTNEYPQPAGLETHISCQLVVGTFDTDFITYCRLCFSFQGLSSLLSKNSGFQVKYDSDNSFYALKKYNSLKNFLSNQISSFLF